MCFLKIALGLLLMQSQPFSDAGVLFCQAKENRGVTRLSHPDRSYPCANWSFLVKSRFEGLFSLEKVDYREQILIWNSKIWQENMSWRVKWSELILRRVLIFIIVLVFLLLCVKDPRTQNMWTMNMFFGFGQGRNCQTSCCGDLRIFYSFRTIF